jgi:hypothetical protein
MLFIIYLKDYLHSALTSALQSDDLLVDAGDEDLLIDAGDEDEPFSIKLADTLPITTSPLKLFLTGMKAVILFASLDEANLPTEPATNPLAPGGVPLVFDITGDDRGLSEY